MKYLARIMWCRPRSYKSLPWSGCPSHVMHGLLAALSVLLLLMPMIVAHAAESHSKAAGSMTKERALKLAEEFGVDVGEVDEEIQKVLGLTEPQGVVVFAVIGATAAERAGIKVKAIIKEVDGKEILTLLDLGRALEKALQTHNFSVATYEPAGIDDQGIGGGLNFHFVRIAKD